MSIKISFMKNKKEIKLKQHKKKEFALKKKGKPKKVVHKEDISFTCVFELPLPMSQADKKAAIEKLDEFSQYDQDVRDREAYVFITFTIHDIN